MHLVELSPQVPDSPHPLERGKESEIASEIAARLIEYADLVSETRAMTFVQKLAALAATNKDGFWLFVRLMTGNLDAITDSYAAQGKTRSLDKQAIQQRHERALAALQIHYPEAATAIIQLRHVTAEIKRP